MSQIQVAQNFREALQVQARVIWALMLRETKTMYGRSKFGYLWVVIQMLFGVCVFWAIRVVMGAQDPSGLPMPLFLLCGMTAWSVFSSCIQKITVSIDANQSLLYYSKVRHFDIIVSRALLIGATNTFVFIVLSLAVYLAGIEFSISNLWPFLISMVYLMLMGTGLGVLCCALKRYFESIVVVVGMILRVGFFISGVIFSYSTLPADLSFVAEYNPIFQLIEYSRTSFSYVYPCDFIDFKSISFFVLSVLFLGFYTELFTRGKVDLV